MVLTARLRPCRAAAVLGVLGALGCARGPGRHFAPAQYTDALTYRSSGAGHEAWASVWLAGRRVTYEVTAPPVSQGYFWDEAGDLWFLEGEREPRLFESANPAPRSDLAFGGVEVPRSPRDFEACEVLGAEQVPPGGLQARRVRLSCRAGRRHPAFEYTVWLAPAPALDPRAVGRVACLLFFQCVVKNALWSAGHEGLIVRIESGNGATDLVDASSPALARLAGDLAGLAPASHHGSRR